MYNFIQICILEANVTLIESFLIPVQHGYGYRLLSVQIVWESQLGTQTNRQQQLTNNQVMEQLNLLMDLAKYLELNIKMKSV